MPHCRRTETASLLVVAGGKLGSVETIPAAGGEPLVVAEDAAADWNPVWSRRQISLFRLRPRRKYEFLAGAD